MLIITTPRRSGFLPLAASPLRATRRGTAAKLLLRPGRARGPDPRRYASYSVRRAGRGQVWCPYKDKPYLPPRPSHPGSR